MELIDNNLLDGLSEKARANERLRLNYNFHTSLDDKSQRLLNAIEPESKLAIHRHVHTAETFLVLRGKIQIRIYDDNGNIKSDVILDPLEGRFGANIPAGEWHEVKSLEKDSVLFECKDGPFRPITDILQVSH